MTILVGMIGSDGIVLAADQCRTRLAASDAEFDDRMLGLKITHVQNHKVAYAVAGDDLTDKVGQALMKSLETHSLQFGDAMESSLESMVGAEFSKLWKKSKGQEEDIERTLLAVFYGTDFSKPQFWRIRISNDPSAKIVDGIATAGARGNSARFFEYYFQRNMPTSRLLLLASHIVLMGCRLDRLMIDGLDVAVFDSAGFHFFDENQKAYLHDRSTRLDALIRKQLFANASSPNPALRTESR